MNERRINAWLEAGIIDQKAAEGIRAYEAAHSRPIALWAVVGLAALAIGLGLVSVVAANWDAIPGQVRLGLHLALLAAGAAWLWWKGPDLEGDHPWFHEAALFVFGLLGLTFFGHVGQVYQTDAPLWQPLAGWLVLFWLTAAAVFVILVWAAWDHASFDRLLDNRDIASGERARLALITGLPVLLAPLAAWKRGTSMRPAFWRRLRQMAVSYAVLGASLLAISAGVEFDSSREAATRALPAVGTWALIAIVSASLVMLLRPTLGGRATAMVLGVSGTIAIFSNMLTGSQIAGAALFMLLWAAIAWASLWGGWRRLFQLAVGVLAFRIVILSLEFNEDLLTSGLGLIVSGLLGLAVAWGAMRVSRRYAPAAGGDSE
jgi:uncharacterized membrane protein